MDALSDDRVTAADVIEFIETIFLRARRKTCRAKARVLDWQKDVIREIYDNPPGTRRAILSVGRKNAKSTLFAPSLACASCRSVGAQQAEHAAVFRGAERDQAAIIFALAAKMIRMSPDLRNAVTIRDTAKSLSCPELGTRYRALSAESTTAFGLSPGVYNL